MRKKQKDLLITNTINTNYFNKNSYLEDKKELKKIFTNIYNNLDHEKNTFHMLSEKFILDFNKLELKRFTKYNSVILIGMGGSALGAQAIYSFLKKKIQKDFIFVDNLDQLKVDQIKKKINLKNNLFVIISKSGNTIETLINSNLFKDSINFKNTIIITERKKSLLSNFAKKKNILHINHKNYIGGRYSVLSEVGMIPAHLMGLKINNFRKNLLTFFRSKDKAILIESIIKLKYIYNTKKINSIVLLNYAPQLDKFLFWCQQLIAESLGKKGKGMLPIVSSAPRDHHSLMQLYLDGPKDKLFYIFSLNLNKKMKIINNIFGKSLSFVENKELSEVVESQKKAFLNVLKKKKIPYREFKVNKIDEKILGKLFSYFMLETSLIGKLIDINPFNQPAVEEVKTLTKQYLS